LIKIGTPFGLKSWLYAHITLCVVWHAFSGDVEAFFQKDGWVTASSSAAWDLPR